MELGELHRTIHGRTAEREVASGEMYRKTKKHGSDAMSQNVRSLAHPGLDLVDSIIAARPAVLRVPRIKPHWKSEDEDALDEECGH